MAETVGVIIMIGFAILPFWWTWKQHKNTREFIQQELKKLNK